MKKLLVVGVILLLLCSCAKKEVSSVRTVERYDRVYTVDTENQTITYDGVTYTFEVQPSGSATFTAPDGSTAFWDRSGNMGSGGYSDGWDTSVWPSDLADALRSSLQGSRERTGNPLLGMLLIAVGAFNALAPGTAWYLSHGWRYKNAEPSEAALFFSRAGGVFSILIGLVLCFI